MQYTGHNSENAGKDSPRTTRPRRMKSLSEAIDSIGTSFQNIYEKHLQSKKPKSKVRKSKSTATLAPQDQLEVPAKEGPKCSRSKSLYTKSVSSIKISNGSQHSPTPSPPLKMATLPRASTKTAPARSTSESSSDKFIEGTSKSRLPVHMPTTSQPLLVIPQEEKATRRESFSQTELGKTETHHSNFKQPDKRRNSMMWVDYITEPGIVINGTPPSESDEDHGSLDTSVDEEELKDERPSIHPDLAQRKIWFNQVTEGLEVFDEEEDFLQLDDPIGKPKFSKRQCNGGGGGFESPRNNYYRKIRKDSIAISLKSRGSTRSPMQWVMKLRGGA